MVKTNNTITRNTLIELVKFTASEMPQITILTDENAESILDDFLNEEQLTISVANNTLALTPKDVEVLFNEVMNPKEANEALKKAMLKFITH